MAILLFEIIALYKSQNCGKVCLLRNLFLAETSDSVLTIKGPQGRINRAVWGPLNKTIISGGEDAVVRIWDSEVGQYPHICFYCSSASVFRGSLVA